MHGNEGVLEVWAADGGTREDDKGEEKGGRRLYMHQCAFMKGRSTELLLLHLTETWKDAIDKGKVVAVLFIDFQKAFDSVNHSILRSKIQANGFSGKINDCLAPS